MSFNASSPYNHGWHGDIARRLAKRFASSMGNPHAALFACVLALLGPAILSPERKYYRRVICILVLLIVFVLAVRVPFGPLTT
jgi:hypothetical protein